MHVQRLDNLYFEKINWENLAERAKTQPITLVLRPSELPTEWRADNRLHFQEAIKNSKGETQFEVWIIEDLYRLNNL